MIKLIKKINIYLIIVTLLTSLNGNANTNNYQHNNLQALKDFHQLLADFNQKNNRTVEINLQLMPLSQSFLQVEQKKEIKNSFTNFHINAKSQNIVITANSNQQFENGIYYVIERLGFHFLGHSDNWIEFPVELNLFREEGVIKPALANVSYFGTGGFGKYPIQKQLKRQFAKRNHLNHEVRVNHTFHSFYNSNKQEIDQLQKQGFKILHDYGKKNKNPNFDEPKTQQIVKQWVERQYLKNPDQIVFPLAPADGIGNKQGIESTNPLIKNTITKYMWMANEVAKYMNKKYPDFKENKFIGYNAYGAGKGVAKAPDFDMEDNFWVVLIPYAFQRDYTGKTKDIDMYEDWTKKHPNFKYAIRDYWNITQWSAGFPKTNLFEKVEKVELWKQCNIEAVRIESTFFSIVTNPHFWVTGKLANYSPKSIEQLYQDYFTLAYKESSEEMFNLYLLFSDFEDETSLPKIFKTLESAYNKAESEVVKNRIIEVMSYTHWMSLWYDSKKQKTEQSALKLERYAKKINALGTLQTWAVYQYNYGGAKPYSYGKSKDKAKGVFFTNQPFAEIKEEILKYFYEDLKKYPVKFIEEDFSFDVSKVSIRDDLPKLHERFQKKNKFEFFIPEQKLYHFQFEARKVGDQMTIFDEDGRIIFEFIASSKGKQKVSVNHLEKNCRYILQFKGMADYIETPNDLVFFRKGGFLASGNRANSFYVLIPKGVQEIIFNKGSNSSYSISGNKTCFQYLSVDGKWISVEPDFKVSSNGTKVYQQIYLNHYKIPVPKGTDGQVWRVFTTRSSWDIKNFDKVISKTPFYYNFAR